MTFWTKNGNKYWILRNKGIDNDYIIFIEYIEYHQIRIIIYEGEVVHDYISKIEMARHYYILLLENGYIKMKEELPKYVKQEMDI